MLKPIRHTFFLFTAILLCLSCSQRKNNNLFYELIPVTFSKDDNKISLIDLDGKVVAEEEFPESSILVVREGVITEYTAKGNTKYHTLDDKKVNQIGQDNYSEGTPFFEGYAIVRAENGMLSMIDKKGNTVIENLSKINDETITLAGIPSNGLIRFKNESGVWGYLNLSGEIAIPARFRACENFLDGKARVLDEEGGFAVIDKKGEVVYKGKADHTYEPVSEGLMAFAESGMRTALWGVVNMKNEILVKDNKFNEIMPFYMGIAPVRKENEWGVINTEGEYVGDLRSKFESTPIITAEGNVIINDNKKIKLFNHEGQLVKTLDDYQNVQPLTKNRYLGIKKNGKSDLIDEEGKEISPDAFFTHFSISKRYNIYATGSLGDVPHQPYVLNAITIESRYFDFNAVFQSVLGNLSTDGMMRLTANSSIKDVLQYYPKQAPSGQSPQNRRRVDRNDDYRFYFSPLSKEQLAGEDYDDDLPEAAPAATEPASSEEAGSVKDSYPYLSEWYNSYVPDMRYTSGLGYTTSFGFTEPPKIAIEGRDPIFTDQLRTIGYKLNPDARLNSIVLELQFYTVDNDVFWKSIKAKLESAGWTDAGDGTYTNSRNSHKISIQGNTMYFSFLE